MPKRVLFIIYSFSYGGGAEKVLSYLIEGLDKRGGYDIDLLEVHHVGIAWEKLPDSVAVLDPVFDETATGLLSRARRGVLRRIGNASPALLRRLVRKRDRYDLVVSFNYMMPTLLVKPGERAVSWNHGSIECLKDEPRKAAWQREGYANAAKVVAIAERTARSIEELFPEVGDKLTVVHNGFPIAAIRAAAEQPAPLRLEHPAVLCVGRLDENKNPLGVLRGFRSILEVRPGAHLYYVGTGELEDAVRREAEEAGIAGNVHLLGYEMNPYPLIRQADCILSLSHAEGFQSVFVEGFAFGVPFISSPAGASEEFAAACGGGVVVRSEAEVGKAFEELFERSADPAYRSALEAYADSLSVDAFVDAFESIAAEVLEGRS